MDKFGIHKVFISSYLKILWNSPEIMHRILVQTEPEIIKTNLAPLLVNNFYCNLLCCYLAFCYTSINILPILLALRPFNNS